MTRFLQVVILFLSCLICENSLFSQTYPRTVSGIVYDENNVTLPGVTIMIEGSSEGVLSDVDGRYAISVPSDTSHIIYSFVGMENQRISPGSRGTIDIRFSPSAKVLDEMVVIGYGAIRRADVTSSISSVSSEEVKNLPMAGADQLLQGKVAGVTINSNGGQPGGGISVRVRGITSVNGNEPLYVIDGVPLGATSNSLEQNVLGGGSGQTSQSALSLINPSDIISIDILKDASAQAIYGSRAANGVILVTTKKGRRGQGKINYDVYYGMQTLPKKLDIMNLQEFAQYQNSLVNEIRGVGLGADSTGEFRNTNVLGAGTDWQDEVYQTGNIASHNLSFSGGSDKTTYFFSGGYFDQKGILIGTSFKRYSLRAGIDQQVKSWLRAGINLNASRSNQKIGLSDAFDAVTSVVLYNSPAAVVKDVYGNFVRSTNLQGQSIGQNANPVAQAVLRDVNVITPKVFGNIYADLNLFKGLTLHNEFNYDFNQNNKRAFQPQYINPVSDEVVMAPSRLSEQRDMSLFWALKNYLNYDNTFGKSMVSFTGGHEAQASTYDWIQAYRDDLLQNLPSLSVGSNANQTISAGAGEWAMESYFVRAGFTFDHRYSVSLTGRTDGSSSFGPSKRWGNFYAGSASWTVTNEAFAKGLKNLNYLKIRIGAGTVGNQNVGGANLYTTNIDLTRQTPWGTVGFPSNLGNIDLGWEAVETMNLGVDATLFNNIAEVSVDIYKKTTKDMLLPAQLAEYSGLSTTSWLNILVPTGNYGQMTNKGIDISVTSYNIRRNNLNWKTSFNFSHYKNRLDRLNDSTTAIFGTFDEYGSAKTVTVSQEGNPVGSFYGFVTDGLFRTQADLTDTDIFYGNVSPTGIWLGDIRFKDLNGDKVVDNQDVQVIGSPHPKFTAGMTNTLSVGNLDLSLFLYGSYGAKIFNYTRIFTEGLNSPWNNQLTSVLDRYTEDNIDGSLPRYTGTGVQQGNTRVSDRYVEDGSYLRIQNLSLGYNLPSRIVSKIKMSNLRVFVSGQNLFTWTKYSGYDPELGAINNRVGLANIDNGHYPNPRTYSVGANVEF